MFRNRLQVFSLSLAAVVLLSCGVTDLPAAPLRTFNSRFYEIHTNLPRQDVIAFGKHMDATFAQYQKRFSSFRSRRRGALPLYLFRSQEDYNSFMSEQGINATNSGGMFFLTGNRSGLATYLGGRSRIETFRVLQHEGFHQFAWDYFGPQLPIWVNEGLAQYFEDAIIAGRTMEIGLADAERIELVRHAIEQRRVIPFNELLSITSAQWSDTLRDAPQQSSLLYAQSWSLVYFLVHADGEKYQPAFNRYLHLVSEGRNSDSAFQDAFGVESLLPAQRRWLTFATNQTPDPINSAIERMVFLGEAMRYLHEQDKHIPNSLSELKEMLQAMQFQLTRMRHGIRTVITAANESMYQFSRSSRDTLPFKLLEPARNDLLPRITAPGLRPEPTLVWWRDDEGQLVQDIEFR